MKPIATRLLLVFVSMVVLLPCAATVGGAERDLGEQRVASVLTPDDGKLERLDGVITVVWGNARPGGSAVATERFFLREGSGAETELLIAPDLVRAAGGARRLNGRAVEVRLTAARLAYAKRNSETTAIVRSLRILPDHAVTKATKAVGGPQPWVSILCKFSDVSSEPKSLSYFQGMYSSSYPGLDHYWRELSYNNANVSGSSAVAWVTLPHPVSHYANSSGGDLGALLADCTAAADPYVFFPNFVGINMMFNDAFGPYAWGGRQWVSLDSQSKIYRVTWEPPWGYGSVAVIAHEMGHGFGLPHSNNADSDSSPYDNPWDVMSDSWYWSLHDSTYGTVGKGTIAYHLDILGWIAPAEKLDIDSVGIYTATIDNLELESTTNLRLVTVQIPDSTMYYTVEVRDRTGYDGNLPDFAVVIHEVWPSRKEEAWLVDPVDPANGADEGAMWRVGECFEDAANEIEICVQSVTTEGYTLKVFYGDAGKIFTDGFEGGGTSGWSIISP
jgi:M6 family metalloprotease-like protein